MSEQNSNQNPQEDIGSSSAPVVASAPPSGSPPTQSTLVSAPSHQNAAHSSQAPSYNVPPPSYQAAMSYPAAPTYGGDKNFGAAPQPPVYYQQPPPFITQTRLPQPEAARVPTANVVVHIQNGIQCRHCQAGVVTRQTDMCCLLCLILLTLFTFPLGLVFLCCVPCTVQNRCSNCQRLA